MVLERAVSAAEWHDGLKELFDPLRVKIRVEENHSKKNRGWRQLYGRLFSFVNFARIEEELYSFFVQKNIRLIPLVHKSKKK